MTLYYSLVRSPDSHLQHDLSFRGTNQMLLLGLRPSRDGDGRFHESHRPAAVQSPQEAFHLHLRKPNHSETSILAQGTSNLSKVTKG